DARTSLSRPQRSRQVRSEAGSGLVDPLRQSFRDPVQFGESEHRTATRARAVRALAPAHVDRPEASKARGSAVGSQIGDVETDGLGPAQSVGVDGLEELRVAQRGEGSLPAMLKDRLNAAVSRREELFELVVADCSPLWATFIVDKVCERVPLVADLLRGGSEALFAVGYPLVPRIGEVVAEQADDGVVSPDRRGSRRALPRLRLRREVLQVAR